MTDHERFVESGEAHLRFGEWLTSLDPQDPALDGAFQHWLGTARGDDAFDDWLDAQREARHSDRWGEGA